MSQLNIEQKSIKELFQNPDNYFLIPDYQRPYAWGKDECRTLWDDLFAFSFPNENSEAFPKGDKYFLGPIVVFKNAEGQKEIIDGQQRLTTLMLLLRAFYEKTVNMRDPHSMAMKDDIGKSVWRANEFGEYNTKDIKIHSEVATDDQKDEFVKILKSGSAVKQGKSRYASNFEFFKTQLDDFLNTYPSYFPDFAVRILNNCVLLPIEAESQGAALRIFSTLNDRGMPLSDADIFKAQFYKYYTSQGGKDKFIETWKELETISAEVFLSSSGSPMDELFTRYMYYERALMGIKSSTTESLRKFFEKDNYKLFKNEATLENLTTLAHFWRDVCRQNEDRFSEGILRRLFVLNYAPNGMWTYIVTVYFMHNKDAEGRLDEARFKVFLDKITAFIWAYAITNPGVNSLRTPIYAEMVNIVNNEEVNFRNFLFERERFRTLFESHVFSNYRAITRSLLTWWAFSFEEQELLPITDRFDIEHIYARNRLKGDTAEMDRNFFEKLGNKALLEQRINIRASDYHYEDKIKCYQGANSKRRTKIYELLNIDQRYKTFSGNEIADRTSRIVNRFIEYLHQNNLLEEKSWA